MMLGDSGKLIDQEMRLKALAVGIQNYIKEAI